MTDVMGVILGYDIGVFGHGTAKDSWRAGVLQRFRRRGEFWFYIELRMSVAGVGIMSPWIFIRRIPQIVSRSSRLQVGKFESIRGVIKQEQQPDEGGKSEPKSEEVKEGNDAKRLRLDRSSIKEEVTRGEGKDDVKVKGGVVEEMDVGGEADHPDDEDSQVRGYFV